MAALRSRPRTLAALTIVAVALAGCMAPRFKEHPSEAILQARAHRDVPPAPACTSTDVSAISPVSAEFPFDDATLAEEGRTALEAAMPWIICHPDTPIVIKPAADSHGTAQEQADLAQRRAETVRTYLIGHGVASARITALALNAAEPAGPPHLVILAEGRRW